MFESADDVTAQDIQAVCDSIEDGVEVIDNNVKENTVTAEKVNSAKKDKRLK